MATDQEPGIKQQIQIKTVVYNMLTAIGMDQYSKKTSVIKR